MKYVLIIIAFPLLSSGDCKKKQNVTEATDKDSIPSCISKLIEEAGKDIPPTTPLQVDEYIYNGIKGYLVTAPCCDHWNIFYDEQCKMICAPSGGFTGKGDEKCPDFTANAKHVRVVWKKPQQ